jgi:hypothetical protein
LSTALRRSATRWVLCTGFFGMFLFLTSHLIACYKIKQAVRESLEGVRGGHKPLSSPF